MTPPRIEIRGSFLGRVSAKDFENSLRSTATIIANLHSVHHRESRSRLPRFNVWPPASRSAIWSTPSTHGASTRSTRRISSKAHGTTSSGQLPQLTAEKASQRPISGHTCTQYTPSPHFRVQHLLSAARAPFTLAMRLLCHLPWLFPYLMRTTTTHFLSPSRELAVSSEA